MKIKLSQQTHLPQTKNGNSRQMPTFLLSKYCRFFDFEEPRYADNSCKRIDPTRNASTIDFNGAPDHRRYPSSIKNISMVGSLINDDCKKSDSGTSKRRIIYLNKIFGQRKELQVPSMYVESHRHEAPEAYQSFVKEKNGFSKPFQFSKLVDELYSSKGINRQSSPWKSFNQIPKTQNNSRKISTRQATRGSYLTTHKSRKYETMQDPRNSGEHEIRRMSCQNTKDKHRKVYDHCKLKDMTQGQTAFSNAMSYLVDSDNILKILEKNRKKKKFK